MLFLFSCGVDKISFRLFRVILYWRRCCLKILVVERNKFVFNKGNFFFLEVGDGFGIFVICVFGISVDFVEIEESKKGS